MINNFCITTLTHNAPDRALALKNTIYSMMQEYTGSKFEWFILVNITNQDIDEVLEWAVNEYSNLVQFNITKSDINLGPGGGINKLNEMSSAYEYQLFIEGDWMLVPNKITGAGDWIQNSIKLLDENPDVDQIHYRRYLDDLDDRQYGFAYWTDKSNLKGRVDNGTSFILLHEREYTNNPSIKRMSRFYETGILPLGEWKSDEGNTKEVKGNPEWGKAELEAMGASRKLLNTTAWLEFGNFVHHEDWPYKNDWDSYIKDEFGCNVVGIRARNRCKYGYLTPGHFFCGACDRTSGLEDLIRHNEIYIRNILPIEHSGDIGKLPDIYSIIDGLVKNPMINAREYIDAETYYNTNYIRKKKS